MRGWQKGVLWGAAILALLLAAGIIALHMLVDGDRLKQLAREHVAQTWGRELVIGDVSLSLLPTPHLYAADIALSNPSWTQERDMLRASGITARFALMPLLHGEFVIAGLQFDGLKIHLETDRDGRRNWILPSANGTQSSFDLRQLSVDRSTVVVRSGDGTQREWQLETLRMHAGSRMRNLAIDARVRRNGQLLELEGSLADLSKAGTTGATTKGKLNLRIGEAALALDGELPLDPALQRYAFAVSADAKSLQQAYAFLDIPERSPVALKASAVLQGNGNRIDLREAKLQMGQLNLRGEGWLERGPRPRFNANLHADRIDMIQTFLDAGRPPLPAKEAGQLFRDKPLPWPLLAGLVGKDGHAEIAIDRLKLRNGIEVSEAAARLDFRDDRMVVPSFSGKLLDGSASGDAVFEGKRQAVNLNLKLDNTLLDRWLKETDKKVALSEGRMQVEMRVHAVGASMKALAASVTGPLDIRIARTQVLSEKAGQAEFWLTGLLSAKDADRIDLSCISARLPFRDGVARGEGIAGARSDVSQLLAGGVVDMRTQTLDLHGRVRARSGVALGWSTFGGNVKIVGPIAKPQWKSDETGKVGTIARIGAAILTSGASIIVTSIWDGANPESDPCQQVFRRQGKSKADGARRDATQHAPADAPN
ncbi:MAG TPA: AsmA family protein [Oxalicibacterium sp.]